MHINQEGRNISIGNWEVLLRRQENSRAAQWDLEW